MTALSYIIGNGDLHGKNVSLVEGRPSGTFRLSPAYDLISTVPYGDRRMALKLEGRDDKFRREHFVEFGARHGVRGEATEYMLDELLERAAKYVGRMGETEFGRRETESVAKVMQERIGELLER